MFDFEPGYWLIVLALGIFFLTLVVVLASSLIGDEEETRAPSMRHRSSDESRVARG